MYILNACFSTSSFRFCWGQSRFTSSFFWSASWNLWCLLGKENCEQHLSCTHWPSLSPATCPFTWTWAAGGRHAVSLSWEPGHPEWPTAPCPGDPQRSARRNLGRGLLALGGHGACDTAVRETWFAASSPCTWLCLRADQLIAFSTISFLIERERVNLTSQTCCIKGERIITMRGAYPASVSSTPKSGLGCGNVSSFVRMVSSNCLPAFFLIFLLPLLS